ncbi:MAG: DUF4126 domain-containing protein [Akkermansia sp.]|nr:DUF4126 domain-containing protein [Akkermansia sp.]
MNIDYLQVGLALCVGVSLSAACGFRIFVPLLAMALGVRLGGLEIDENLVWVGSDAAIACLGAATLVEVLAYYIPVVDNFLDSIAGPAALVAGALVTGGMLGSLPDWLQWSTGIVAGAGVAGTVQLGTTAVRAASTTTSAGVGNPVVSTAENIMSTIGSFLAIVAPFLAVAGAIVLLFLCIISLRKIIRLIAHKREKAAAATAAT